MVYSIGVDVGSGSVRAGLFTESGKLVKVATKEILVNNPEPGFYEQSSEDIWDAVVFVVKVNANNE
jgi:ribulose kinase